MPKRRRKTSSKQSERSADGLQRWEPILRQIPGYDPFVGADGYYFDESGAHKVETFFRTCLQHIKGRKAGEYIELSPWQLAIVANLYGWKRKSDGMRRYREALVFLPRKNGKTTLAAGLGNFMLFCDDEPGAEIYCAAAERDQAALLFSVARAQVMNEPALHAAAKIYQRSIVIEETASSFKAISAKADTKHGYHSHCVIVDELHAQKNRDLVDALTTSTGGREQPLVIYITTSDYEREGSICNEKHSYACKVRDNVINDPSFLPVIYEASRDDDWTDSNVWQKANPGIGETLSLDYLQRECQRAQETPTYENTFKRLHLNIRTEQDVRWLPIDKWDACNDPVDMESLRNRPCFAGLDLSSTTDISALVLLFPVDDRYAVVPYFWIPGDNAHERERRDRVPYVTWHRQGLITLTDGNVIDYELIRGKINELRLLYQIKEVAIDRWNATQLATWLQDDGLEVIGFGQGTASMSAPSKELEKLVIDGKIMHGGNPVLRWMASNVSVEIGHSDTIKPSKKKSTERIDGIIALIMALGRAILTPTQRQSVYEDQGIFTV